VVGVVYVAVVLEWQLRYDNQRHSKHSFGPLYFHHHRQHMASGDNQMRIYRLLYRFEVPKINFSRTASISTSTDKLRKINDVNVKIISVCANINNLLAIILAHFCYFPENRKSKKP